MMMKIDGIQRLSLVFLSFLLPLFNDTPLAAAPAAWWNLDETSGSIAEDSIGDANGILMNEPIWADGIIDGALSFDGLDDYVQVPNHTALNPNADSWSIAFWMQSNLASQSTTIISKRGTTAPYVQYAIGLSAGDSYSWPAGRKITFLFREAAGIEKGGYTTADINITNWTHVCVVLDRNTGTVHVYINGEPVSVTLDHTGDLPALNNNAPLYIGGNPNNLNRFEGLIDDVKIHNTALSEQEIIQMIAAFIPQVSLDPAAWWKLDETSGTIAEDSVGNADGVLLNGPEWSEGIIDGALPFNGLYDYVEVPNTAALNPNDDNWSVAFWLRSNTLDQSSMIISKWADSAPHVQYSIGLSAGDSYNWPAGRKVTFLFRENNGIEKGGYTTADIDISSWTHVCVVLDKTSSTVYVYIDGQSVPVTLDHDDALPAINNNAPLYIGGNPGTLNLFDGGIDDVRFYNVALSQTEAFQLSENNVTGLPDPVAWWAFDETSGSIAEDSVGNANGLLSHGLVWSTGIDNGALSFDGKNDYIQIPGYKGITGGASRTCCAWIKTPVTGGSGNPGPILTWGDAVAGGFWTLRLQDITGQGQPIIAVNGGSAISLASVTDNQWHHIAVVLEDDGTPNAAELRLYIDGIEDTNLNVTDEPINTIENLDVLIGSDGQENYFQGLIDDVRIYDSPLTQTDILDLLGETLPSEVWVDDDYTSVANNDGHTWGYDAFDAIQDGINFVLHGGTVNVAAGTYIENITLKDGIKLTGAGADLTTIDGNVNGSVVTAVNCGPDTTLYGFTVTNGNSSRGGGMANYNSSPTITDCVFRDNLSSGNGWGAGIYNEQSDPIIVNCEFISNISDAAGGGIYNNSNSNPVIINCAFRDNYASAGAGISNASSNVIISNSIFVGNTASYRGGGIHNAGSNLTLLNSTFYGNSASENGSVLYSQVDLNGHYYSRIHNCIMWNNVARFSNFIYTFSGSPVISFCDIEGETRGGSSYTWPSTWGSDGGGNMYVDPLFVDPDGTDNILGTQDDDLRLSSHSPCIDAGSNGYFAVDVSDLDNDGDMKEAVPFDLDGNSRYMDTVNKTDSGMSFIAGGPIIDMGAYEHPGRTVIEGDINHDWVVNVADLALLAEHWLEDERVP